MSTSSHPSSVDPHTTSVPNPNDGTNDNNNNNNSSSSDNHPLLRDESTGMNPVTLVTGYHGPRGERIRHVVHEGALRLPAPALDPMITTTVTTTTTDTTTNPVVLPDCDAVKRPSLSLDPHPQPLVVTEVYQKETVQDDISPIDGTIRTTTLSQTIIQNVNLAPPPVPVAVVVGGGQESGATPMDIDPAVVVVSIQSEPTSITTSATPSTTAAATVVLPITVPVTATTSSDLPQPIAASSTTTTTPADPTLQPQQISNMEQALLSTIQSTSSSTATTGMSNNGTTAVAATNHHSGTAVVSHLPTTVASSIVVDAPTGAVARHHHPPPQGTFAPGAVIPLTPRPTPPHESTTRPITTTTTTIHHGPTWYQPNRVAALERAVLSEWFDGSATHRTEASYVEARERILALATTLPDQYVTGTMVRRTVSGDAGSLLRLHAFLTSHQMINRNAINESTPAPMILLTKKQNSNKRAKISTNDWDDAMKWNVMQAVVEQSRTKMTPAADHDPDWSAVAKFVGHGVTATECEHLFLTMSIPTVRQSDDHFTVQDGSVTPDVVASVSTTGRSTDPNTKRKMQQDWITDLVTTVDPALRRTVTMAALSHTSDTNNNNNNNNNDLSQVPKAAVLGLIVRDAMDTAQEQEERVVEILSEVMELRMQRIESRLSTLDDVEDMLEAERVALELERRDLYTARCRHWFGGT